MKKLNGGESVLKYRNIENIRLKLPIIQKSKSWEYHHEVK